MPAAIVWTPELESEIARRLVNKSLLKICQEDNGKNLPSRAAINEHLASDDNFWTICARARRIHALQRLENVEVDVDGCTDDNARSVKVKVDFAIWLAERLLSKEYSPQSKIEHSGSLDLSLADSISKARKRVEP